MALPADCARGEAAGALVAFALARKTQPRAVREKGPLLADFLRGLVTQGVETRWPPGVR